MSKADYSKWEWKQHSPQLQGIACLVPFYRNVSPSRLAMFASQSSQGLVIKGATTRRIMTGMEQEFGKYTHKIEFPCRALIKKLIYKYPTSLGYNGFKENPLTTVIYQDVTAPDSELCVLDIPRYHCNHKDFGFTFVFTEAAKNLRVGAVIEAGTVIAQTPALDRIGNYKYGLEGKVALLTLPGTIEDGCIISESFAKRMTTKCFGSRTISWGSNRVPLNLYGNDSDYKIFPDLGEYIRDDGVIFATREVDPYIGGVNLTKRELQKLDFFDNTVYAIPGAKIIDIVVRRGKSKVTMPAEMTTQFARYFQSTLNYHNDVVHECNTIRREGQNGFKPSPELQQLYVMSRGFVECARPDSRVTPMFHKSPIDEFMITIHFEYELVPGVGYKITGTNGDKAIVCAVWPDDAMPGIDVIIDPSSKVGRNNPGSTYEPFINNCAETLVNQLRPIYNPNDAASVSFCWEKLLGFYAIIAPLMLQKIQQINLNPVHHLNTIMEDGITVLYPNDNPVKILEALFELRDKYPPTVLPVTYRAPNGKMITTKRPVLIGSSYFLLLEKIGNTWTGVSSPRYNHYGIPAKITTIDKYSQPGRTQPVRILGESEVRLITAVCGGDTVAELLDQTNNYQAHTAIVNTILSSPMPTALVNVIDRRLIPRGNGRILRLVKHMLMCAGTQFVYSGDQYATVNGPSVM